MRSNLSRGCLTWRRATCRMATARPSGSLGAPCTVTTFLEFLRKAPDACMHACYIHTYHRHAVCRRGLRHRGSSASKCGARVPGCLQEEGRGAPQEGRERVGAAAVPGGLPAASLPGHNVMQLSIIVDDKTSSAVGATGCLEPVSRVWLCCPGSLFHLSTIAMLADSLTFHPFPLSLSLSLSLLCLSFVSPLFLHHSPAPWEPCWTPAGNRRLREPPRPSEHQ